MEDYLMYVLLVYNRESGKWESFGPSLDDGREEWLEIQMFRDEVPGSIIVHFSA
jgi:hypothetical protein